MTSYQNDSVNEEYDDVQEKDDETSIVNLDESENNLLSHFNCISASKQPKQIRFKYYVSILIVSLILLWILNQLL